MEAHDEKGLAYNLEVLKCAGSFEIFKIIQFSSHRTKCAEVHIDVQDVYIYTFIFERISSKAAFESV